MLPGTVWSAFKKLAALARALALQTTTPTEPTHADKANPFIAAILAAQGDAEPEPDELAYLWPDNVAAWDVWCDVQTQWRHGMSGATGLDYAGVRAHLDELGLTGDERKEVYEGIRAAERATLEARAEREASEPKQ